MHSSWFSVVMDLLLIAIQHIIEAGFIARYIRARKKIQFYILYTVLCTLIYGVIEYFIPDLKGLKGIFLPLTGLILGILYRERSLFKSIICIVILYLALIGSDYLNMPFLRLLIPEHIDEIINLSVRGGLPINSLSFYLLLFIRSFGITEVFIALLFTYLVLRGSMNPEDSSDDRLNRFIPVFVLEIIFMGFLMVFTARTVIATANIAWMMIAFIFLFFVLDLLVLRMLRSAVSAEQLRHEQAELSLYAQANSVAYNQIMEGNTRFSALRHDMLNQLQTIGLLLERGENETAAEQLRAYADDIRSSGGFRTGNSIADAVLSIKETSCKAAGAVLEVSGRLPQQTPLNHEELCSVIGNMLDNAIHGASASGDTVKIRFSAGIRDDKLVLSCTNPSDKPINPIISAPTPGSEHGWGLYILDQMATEHGGAFTLASDNGVVSSLFWVPFEHREVIK